ncbi:helix-turn-helix domain-containing protein, partial [Thermodesulfobacteriota bacterium]
IYRIMALFMSYDWPGNVRELRSALEYAFVIAEEGLILPEQLPLQILEKEKKRETGSFPQHRSIPSQKMELIEALRRSKGNQSQAARILGVNRVTVWNRMKKYGIDLKRIVTT